MPRGDVLRYLADCYEADHRQPTLWDVFADKVSHAVPLAGNADLLTGLLPRQPLSPYEDAAALARDAFLYRKERWCAYGSFFICGRLVVNDALRVQACAPLILFPATLVEQDGVVEVSLGLESPRLNQPLLEALCGDAARAAAVAQSLYDEVLGERLDAPRIGALASLLREHAPQVDTTELSLYPRLHDAASLRAHGARHPVAALPAAVVALLPMADATRGVLGELRAIADTPTWPPPLQALIAGAEAPSAAGPAAPRRGDVPAVLSRSQRAALDAASVHPLTMLVGPPGTGKSFTAAALALEHLSRNETVLIASKMDHAVDVIAGKIDRGLGLGPCAVRAGKREHRRDLLRFLDELLHGSIPGGRPHPDALPAARQDLKRLDGELATLERDFVALDDLERRRGAFLARCAERPRLGLIARVRRHFLERRITSEPAAWRVLERLEAALAERHRTLCSLVQLAYRQRLCDTLDRHRPELKRFVAALRARTGGKQEDLFAQTDFRVILGALPIWLTTVAEVNEALPLHPALFDCVIIDEASQCDPASTLPCLYRAKRAVVCGDPHQLRHVSFLSRDQQRHLAERHGLGSDDASRLSFRDRSLLDLAGDAIDDQRCVAMLDEHFRSVPAIIAFSNERFYARNLRVMTQRPGDPPADTGVRIHRVPGRREPDGTNPIEADALLEKLAALIAAEDHLPAGVCHSVGILSPFRAQVDLLLSRLEADFRHDALAKHDVMVGTAHTFQGEERDVMFLSFVVGAESPHGSHHWLDRADVFNVSVTRARLAQHVFTSVEADAVRYDTLFRQYLQHASTTERNAAPPRDDHRHDAFLADLCGWLASAGLQHWPRYPVAGLPIDVVVRNGDRSIGIDLLGFPGPHAETFPLERLRIFGRAGLPILPLPYSRWVFDRDGCCAAIRAALGAERETR